MDRGLASTKQESLHLGKEFIEDWYLTRRGKSRQGELISETPVKQAAAVFEREHEIVTEVQCNPVWSKDTRRGCTIGLILSRRTPPK